MSHHVTKSIRKALQARFCAPEWALFMEVARRTGGMARSADAIAMNLFQSRGLRVHGVEIKASRSDWLRELKAPEKADEIAQFCDHWWIATVPDVVQPGELPPTWGLMILTGGRMVQRVAPPKLPAKPMDRGFIAALLRRASERAAAELREACDERLAAERQRINERIEQEVGYRTTRYEYLRKAVNAFEMVSGISISDYRGGELGAAAKVAMTLKLDGGWGSIQKLADDARRWADAVDATLPKVGDVDG